MSYTLSHAIHDLHALFDLPPATLDVAQDVRDVAHNPELVARRRVMAGWYDDDAIDNYLDAVRRAALALSWCDACGEVILDEHHTDDEICGNGDVPGFFLHSTCGAVCAGRCVEARWEIYQAGRRRAGSTRCEIGRELEAGE